MAELKQELREVKEELSILEDQVSELLERQQNLLARQDHLEQAIADEERAPRVSEQRPHVPSKDWAKTKFPWSKKLEELKAVFKIKTLRPLQLSAMNATMSDKDCILIMPTGGGKSLCFQLTALAVKGVTLVVAPLVSLMEDQLMALTALGVKAALLNASSTKEHIKAVQDGMTNQRSPFKLLYVTPEKLAKSKRFMAKLEKMHEAGLFSRLVIDEVHCCSQWGHDFRPDYKFLGVMRRQFPGVPILGLTATATTKIVQDVKKMLNLPECIVFRDSFNRRNLFYEVRAKPSGMTATVEDMKTLIEERFKGQSGIIYCLTQKDTQDVAKELQALGIRTGCYHANLEAEYRSSVHRKWVSNFTQVVVATIAFGMGIDKPNVRFVIHHSISKSMENYYQESGRAGRDDQPAHCILYASFADVFRQSTMVFTEQTGLDNLYGMVRYVYDVSRCRRTLIAKHFGETWDAAKCNKMCDHCSTAKGAVGRRDVTSYCSDLLAILNEAKVKERRVTGLKLLDAWLGKGEPVLRVAKVRAPKDLWRGEAERVLIHCLLNGYVKEDFHFTPYSTISYLLPASKSRLLSDPNHKVYVDVREAAPRKTKAASSSGSGSSGVRRKSSDSGHPARPIVINPANSRFIEGGVGIPESSPPPAKRSQSDAAGGSRDRKRAASGEIRDKKRRPKLVPDLDADLDFCDTSEGPEVERPRPAAKKAKRKSRDDRHVTSSLPADGGAQVVYSSDDSLQDVEHLLQEPEGWAESAGVGGVGGALSWLGGELNGPSGAQELSHTQDRFAQQLRRAGSRIAHSNVTSQPEDAVLWAT